MNWISVKEKMPTENSSEQSKDVLVCTIHNEIQVGYTHKGYWQEFYGSREINEVTHWAELPELPE